MFKRNVVSMPFISAHEGIKLAAHFEIELIKARTNYKLGDYSGHPEEQLEKIDYFKHMIQEVENAKARNWEPQPEKISKLVEWSYEWENLNALPGSGFPSEKVNPYEKELDWAEKGLI